MQTPLYVRPLLADERAILETGLRSASAFTLRRCQILLASAEGQGTTTIAHDLRCTQQTVRNAVSALADHGAQSVCGGLLWHAAGQPSRGRSHGGLPA